MEKRIVIWWVDDRCDIDLERLVRGSNGYDWKTVKATELSREVGEWLWGCLMGENKGVVEVD